MNSRSSVQSETREANMLNDNQKRKISATLRFLDADISELEQLFAGNNDIPHQKRKNLTDLLSLAAQRSQGLSAAYDLQERPQTAIRKAISILSSLWVDLQDIKADKLRNYGTVSSEIESDFDPEIDKIMDLISQMQRILRNRS